MKIGSFKQPKLESQSPKADKVETKPNLGSQGSTRNNVKTEANTFQAARNEDRFLQHRGSAGLNITGESTNRSVQAQALGRTNAATGAGGAQPVRGDVQQAVDEIERYPESHQANVLAEHLRSHGSDSAEDVEYRRQLLETLGADRVGEMLSDTPPIDGIYSRGHAEREVLSAAVDVYSPADQGRLVAQLGSEQLSALTAQNVYEAGRPDMDPAENAQLRQELESVARLMGNVHSLPAGSPGRAEVTATLERLRSGQTELRGIPGEEVAAWMVSRSGSDSLKLEFANEYLDAFKQDPSSLSATEARGVAMVLGSMEPPSRALAPIINNLDHEQRTAFLAKMTEASYGETPEWGTPFLFNQDVSSGVTAFLGDVARLNPATFGDPQAARDFRVEAFRAGTRAVDNDLFNGAQGFKDALASMFANDTQGILSAMSNTTGPHWDTEGRDLAKFFEHVAFRNEGASRQRVVDAMQNYLGIGERQGVADLLAENKGNPEFMAAEGNVLARQMGFLLGALHQGANSAVKGIDNEYARKKAVVDIIGSIAESAIEASPAAGAYKAIRSGTGGQADVNKVFDWLAQTYLGGEASASKEGVTRLNNAIISNAWAPFFGDSSLSGARSEDLVNLYSLINAGVALADGTPEPSIRIGG